VQGASVFRVQWSPTGASGLYFYRLETRSVDASELRYVETRKMLLIR
jgi:hypothetical protein